MKTFSAILYKGPAHGRVVKDVLEGVRSIVIPMQARSGIVQIHYNITEHVMGGKRIFEMVMKVKK